MGLQCGLDSLTIHFSIMTHYQTVTDGHTFWRWMRPRQTFAMHRAIELQIRPTNARKLRKTQWSGNWHLRNRQTDLVLWMLLEISSSSKIFVMTSVSAWSRFISATTLARFSFMPTSRNHTKQLLSCSSIWWIILMYTKTRKPTIPKGVDSDAQGSKKIVIFLIKKN